ncbi:MAG: MBL fold metallo-hydrolase [Prevotella sp.]|nr:MBL fold metallo-hydrolase [Bacteroides sp.]MCM1366483.1 MBL fold metallo-hydrolase [Prevotella sp.]MCM1436822.1 MBL fold metallo-hydrolase [Prevotella sp.]
MAKRKSKLPPLGQFTIDFSDAGYDASPGVVSASSEILPNVENEQMQTQLKFFSFGSGSSGNSCYLGTNKGGIIIDAGVNDSDIYDTLERHNVPVSHIKAILLTHDHTDHIKYVYKLLRSNRNIRLYCTNRVILGILRKHNISKRIKEYHNPIFKEIPFSVLDFRITAFEVPHDGSDNVGFSIEYCDKRFVLATDLGAVTERADFYMSQANYLVIEANYDLQMLIHGRYPEHLKARIRTDHGHMDNTDTATFLKKIAGRGLTHIFLCHLSQDNNTPDLARQAVKTALETRGFKVGDSTYSLIDRNSDIHLAILPRLTASPIFIL